MAGLAQASQGALLIVFYIAGPILGVILVIGLVVSVLLAVTQVNEPTLSFVPKFFATTAAIAVLGPWLLHQLEAFTIGVFASLPRILQ
ncbi:MAG TPA: flagellar biosynthetic protein FliQ [Stellaceae bacterium]|nr:flagellar biosynthetic protein FliQ [Stellaceae bacterium]